MSLIEWLGFSEIERANEAIFYVFCSELFIQVELTLCKVEDASSGETPAV